MQNMRPQNIIHHTSQILLGLQCWAGWLHVLRPTAECSVSSQVRTCVCWWWAATAVRPSPTSEHKTQPRRDQSHTGQSKCNLVSVSTSTTLYPLRRSHQRSILKSQYTLRSKQQSMKEWLVGWCSLSILYVDVISIPAGHRVKKRYVCIASPQLLLPWNTLIHTDPGRWCDG